MIRFVPQRLLVPLNVPGRLHRSSSTQSKSSKEVTAETGDSSDVLTEIMSELREAELSEDEISKMRHKSRIKEITYQKFIKKEATTLEAKYDFQINRLRSHYGRFGKDSKLNPGLCWPTKKEIEEMVFYDKMFEPSLQERMRNVEEKRLAEEQRKQEVEAEVDKNMAKLDKWLGDYYGKIEQKKTKAEELRQKRELLVEEISEYLGYEIDAKDPRFKEAVEQRDKEKKKAMKVKKQQESYDKMLDKLRKIAQQK